ncbi:MAG: hypothetical protein ACP5FH_11560 [Terracidiphilus sp.]
MKSIFRHLQFGPRAGGRPPVAVELSPGGVLAAVSAGPGQAPASAYEPLPQGSLVPGIAETNLRAPEAVANAIRAALGQLAPRSRALTLILPDNVVRVFLLDFDSLPARAAEAVPILRFRLRKMVPFDVERAGVGYQILVEGKTECKALAAVIPAPVLEEYENLVRQAGYEPGAVLSSSLAALAAIDSTDPVLVASLSAQTLTTLIAQGQNLLLYRTLELPGDRGRWIEELRRGVRMAAAYYEDRLGVCPSLLYYAGAGRDGIGAAEEFARLLDGTGPSGFAVADLSPRPASGAANPQGNQISLAGVTGALAGVA